MKKTYLYILFILSVLFTGCNDKWDDYYHKDNSDSEIELSQTILEFLQTHPEYSAYTDKLKSTGLISELSKDQQITLWVVDNDHMEATGADDDDLYRMKYHINNLPFIRSDLKNGLRIRSLNGIYFQVIENGDNLYVNSSEIVKSYKLKDGVVHVIDRLMKSRINMYDFLKELDDDYSMIRDSIFTYNVQLFDKANSTPVGVDKTGNTIYDSVFYVYNPIFDKVEFNSEFKQFTVFVPSNKVIKDCFKTMEGQYEKMGKTVTKSDSILAYTWLKEAMFYNGTDLDFMEKDITSSFNRVWRTTVQQLESNEPVELSNGLLYYVKKVKIPNNVIITRVKSLVEYWQYQDAIYPDPADLYTFKGLVGTPSILTDAATPKPSVMPNYLCLNMSGDKASAEEFSVEFPPLEKYDDNGKTKVRVMQVPAGEYNLYMGFRSSGHPYVNVYFNGRLVNKGVNASLSTPWNFDRVTETEKDRDKVNGTAKWDGLGGTVGVVNVDGDGMASFRIKVEFEKLQSASANKRFAIFHWALKPTDNNY